MWRNTITVRLFGGLGNQLFQFIAGLAASKVHNCKLQVDFSWQKELARHRNSSITDLHLFRPDNVTSQFPSRWNIRVVDKLIIAGATRSKTISSILRINAPEHPFYVDPSQLTPPKRCVGYYQSPRYFHYLTSNGHLTQSDFDISTPSFSYLESLKKLSVTPFIAVHVRGGDYLHPKSSYVELTRNYYLEAIKSFKHYGEHIPVYAFSNDQKQVFRIFGDTPNLNYFDDTRLSAAETLSLMSRAVAVVCANSTFSYWAALIGGPNNTVVAPKSWFKFKELPHDFYPSRWQLI